MTRLKEGANIFGGLVRVLTCIWLHASIKIDELRKVFVLFTLLGTCSPKILKFLALFSKLFYAQKHLSVT